MRGGWVGALALALGTVSLLDAPVASAAPTMPAGFTTVAVATGQQDYDLTDFVWVGDGDLLSIGKEGRVTFVPHGGTPRVLAQVPDVRAINDHGLVGVAVANDYATSGRVYLSYVLGPEDGSGWGMLEEWRASPAASPTSLTRVRALVDGRTTSPVLHESGTTHGADSVRVAPDDTLFWSLGDNAGNNGDPRTLRAQDLDQPYGKVLHLTPDGRGVPTNPYYAAAAPTSWRSMVWASGLRNPFRFTLDPRTGTPVVGDVGWATTEEVSVLPAGANAGWPCYEGAGRTTFAGTPTCAALYAAGSATPPTWTYPHAGQGAAVTAGDFYTGTAYPERYRGALFLGDYARQTLWTMTTDPAGRLVRAPETAGFATEAGAPVAFHPGPNGDMTLADIASGQVRRLVYSPGNRAPVAVLGVTTDAGTRTVRLNAAGSYDLDGDALSYSWAFGDGTTARGAAVSHSYAGDAAAVVTLTARDELGAVGTATTTVHPGNRSPDLVLHAPTGHRYAVGDAVDLTAEASDPEDGALAVTWESALMHCPFAGSCHRHPDTTVTGPAFSRAFPDHGADTTMLVTVSATDRLGATTRRTYEATPDVHTLSVVTPVPVTLDGTAAASAPVVAGAEVQVVAPATSGELRFTGWSDGGASGHALVMPARDLTLTARYATPVDVKYASLGGARSVLGLPVGPEYALPGGRGRTYAAGRIYSSTATGAHEVHGRILTVLLETGGVPALGFPTSDETAVSGGRASSFTRGRIYYSVATSAHVLRGAVLARYLAAGGPARYGLPSTDDRPLARGRYARFTGGRSIYDSAAGAHLVYGKIMTKYAAMGYERSCLGYPTTDEYAVGTLRRNRFEHGSITWDPVRRTTTARC